MAHKIKGFTTVGKTLQERLAELKAAGVKNIKMPFSTNTDEFVSKKDPFKDFKMKDKEGKEIKWKKKED